MGFFFLLLFFFIQETALVEIYEPQGLSSPSYPYRLCAITNIICTIYHLSWTRSGIIIWTSFLFSFYILGVGLLFLYLFFFSPPQVITVIVEF